MGQPSARLRLRVSPSAKRDEIVGPHGEAWKVRVAASPERGRANEAVLQLLARRLSLPRQQLSVVSGHAAADKVVELRGIAAEEAERRLGAEGGTP